MKKRCQLCGRGIFKESLYCSHCQKMNIHEFGAYRMGLCDKEIEYYLSIRTDTKNVKNLIKKFNKIAGVNTMAVGPQGQSLMYRWDVERFTERLLSGTPTYFD
jgi:hypothetical protein